MSHKFTLVSVIAMIAIVPTMVAIADSTITSKGYVDTQIDTTQVKIPATGTGNGGIGNTVMTYTNTPGRIGERGIYTGESSYNASSDADKLITASALKGAFDSIPTTDTTTLVCANPGTCDLWTIVDQTAMGPSAVSGGACPDLMSLIGNVVGTGYTANNSTGEELNTYNNNVSHTIIDAGPLAFAVDYGDKGMITGHGRCSTQSGTGIWNGASSSSDVTTMSTLPDSSGENCWCQLDGYTTTGGSIMQSLSAPWVFHSYFFDASDCASDCANICARGLMDGRVNDLAFRAAVFGSVCQ